ncbi:hypothetical protein FNAPI_10709 [Fusarium napiforme]|uniref:Uncharacterized protein n=1 Tax=Fusarium napiforme TaxID=42672 RepID=A0A8H5IN62_9HYPO|nr:hypothetical protein FNAPI_10709 [Fusarium napiforme]
MFPGQRKRGWRQCLADSYEKTHGPLDDPVPTFGAKLVTFPSTPTLPMCFATPDPDFLEELDRRLCAVEAKPVPKCLQPLRFDEEPAVELSCSDNDTDDEGSESFRNSMREARIRVYASAGIDIVAVEAKRRARKLAREKRQEDRAAESNNTESTLPSSHDPTTKPPSNTTEADNAGCQANNQKRKRQIEDEEDQPRCKVVKPSDTTSPRPRQRTRPSFKPQASYSPPQTPSPTDREHAQGQAGSSLSPESLVAQQPTPEGDTYLKLERGRESPTARAEFSNFEDDPATPASFSPLGSLLHPKLVPPSIPTTNIRGKGDTAIQKASPLPDHIALAIAVAPSRQASSLFVSATRPAGCPEVTSRMPHWSIGAITASDEDAYISRLFCQYRWRDAGARQRLPAGNNALDEAQEPWLWGGLCCISYKGFDVA